MLRANDRADRIDRSDPFIPRFLLADVVDFKKFKLSNFLAPRSRAWIVRAVETEMHLFFLGSELPHCRLLCI
jgi:hypothetical protein